MSDPVVKLIHVGLGQFGQDWERNVIPRVPEVEVVAWVDPYAPVLESARESLGLPPDRCFGTLAEAIAAVDAAAVQVTAPQPVHIPLALEAIAAGKHVLVEKPFAMSIAEGMTAIEAAERAGVVLMVNQQYRHYPAVREAARIVADGDLGPVGTVRVDFRRLGEADDTPEVMERFYGIPHPLIFDMSIHHFDLMRLILGRDAVSVYAKPIDPPWSRYVDEGAAAITIEFEGGTVVSYTGSWMSRERKTHWAGEWTIELENGVVEFTSRAGGEAGVAGDSLAIAGIEGDPEAVELDRPEAWGRASSMAMFVDAIRTGTEPETSARFNLGSLALMEAAARSSKTGRVEPVQPTR